ncbi:hypothetical protein [Leuconostoc citreum]|nr:hypothetical protein [Leuconostoc citreum]
MSGKEKMLMGIYRTSRVDKRVSDLEREVATLKDELTKAKK